MQGGTLVKKIHMNCPVCDMEHEVEARKRKVSMLFKDEEIIYEETYYYCENAREEENEFEVGSMTNQNLMNARNAYRIKKGLLTSDEIVEIRESYGLSQVDLARLMGWGEATVSRYESKAIQDGFYDVMLRIVRDNPTQTLEFLKKNESKFSETKLIEIKNRVAEKINSCGKEFLSRQMLEGNYIHFDKPSDANGYTTLCIDKIEAMISYIAKSVPNLYKVKLMKMLWYSDVLSYVANGFTMSGMVYRHETMGALPIGHEVLMKLQKLNIQEELSIDYDTKFHILPTEGMDYSILSDEEKTLLDKVIAKFKNYNTSQIVQYMHKETAYKETTAGEIIPFSLTKDIKAF